MKDSKKNLAQFQNAVIKATAQIKGGTDAAEGVIIEDTQVI